MVVREKGWKIHGKVCEEWNNAIVFVYDYNEKMVERFDFFLLYFHFIKKFGR
jgi:hypothetical protein